MCVLCVDVGAQLARAAMCVHSARDLIEHWRVGAEVSRAAQAQAGGAQVPCLLCMSVDCARCLGRLGRGARRTGGGNLPRRM